MKNFVLLTSMLASLVSISAFAGTTDFSYSCTATHLFFSKKVIILSESAPKHVMSEADEYGYLMSIEGTQGFKIGLRQYDSDESMSYVSDADGGKTAATNEATINSKDATQSTLFIGTTTWKLNCSPLDQGTINSLRQQDDADKLRVE